MQKDLTHLIIGLGEVGKALQEILQCDGSSNFDFKNNHYDMIHICFPYFGEFNNQVERYKNQFTPKYTVIHSTVPIGTSKKLGASHSPVRGKHPHLKESILTIPKYVGGVNAVEVANELSKYKIPVFAVASSDDTEAGKLYSLMQFGKMILLNKEIKDHCEKNNINFDIAYTDFNESYNQGYKDLGHSEFTRPVLKYIEGGIGGHCVTQMMELLDTESAKEILKTNEKLCNKTK